MPQKTVLEVKLQLEVMGGPLTWLYDYGIKNTEH